MYPPLRDLNIGYMDPLGNYFLALPTPIGNPGSYEVWPKLLKGGGYIGDSIGASKVLQGILQGFLRLYTGFYRVF